MHGQTGFRLEGNFLKNNNEELITCTLKKSSTQAGNWKKEISLNGEAYSRFSRHLGYFPAVIISPDDAQLINGVSEQRRRFLDTLLSQLDLDYLDHLIAYQKILQQRNSLLKSNSPGQTPDKALIAVLDNQLTTHGSKVFEKREAFIPQLTEKVRFFYQQIAQKEEKIDLNYQSSLTTTGLADLLLRNRHRDIQLQRTSDGIHRDELLFLLNGHPLKQIGSQGQRKNHLFALKLAQYDLLRSHKGFLPLLLLDDIFEKLDHHRITHLISLISGPDFGQVFITDTEEDRLRKAFIKDQEELQVIRL